MCGQEVYPPLVDAELDTILGRVMVIDRDGYAPTDDAYTGTYDLARATVAACLLHATKAAADTDFSNANGRVAQQQVIQNWRELANEARRGVIGTLNSRMVDVIDGVPI